MIRRYVPIIVMLLLGIVAIYFLNENNGIMALLVLVVPTLLFLIWFLPIGSWFSARKASVKVDFTDLVMMRMRRINPSKIVEALIKAKKAGLKITVSNLEMHYLAGGNVDQVVDALIMAREANIPLSFEYAAAFDFMGGGRLESIDSINKALGEIEEESKKRQEQVEQENKERQEPLEQENNERQAQLEQEDLQKMYIWTGTGKSTKIT